MKVIPWNSNPKDEISYQNLTNGVKLFMPFHGPTCHFCKSLIQDLYKLCKVRGAHDVQYKLHYGRRMG